MGWRYGPYQGRTGSNPERYSLPTLWLGLRVTQKEAILAEHELKFPNPHNPSYGIPRTSLTCSALTLFCRTDLT